MFESIQFSVHDKRLEIGDESFLLGELTTDVMNISPEEYQRMAELLEGDPNFEELVEVHSILRKRSFFRLHLHPNELMEADQYRELVDDIYAFNQTMFWFVDRFLMTLKKLDSENFAAALFDFYSHPGAEKMIANPLRNSIRHIYRFNDPAMITFAPCEVEPGRYAIYELVTAQSLQSFLKFDFMRALMVGHSVRRCKNCKRFFLSTNGYHTDYCDRPLADDPSRTCRNRGAKNHAKEKADNNPAIRSYRRAYQRISADKSRGRITEAEWALAKTRLADLRDMAMAGKFSDTETEERMRSENLYWELGIQRKGGK